MRSLPVLVPEPAGNEPPSASAAHEAGLARAGWVRRSVAEPPRLDEIVTLYRELGYEVMLEPMSIEGLGTHCNPCVPALAGARVVYTRRG